MQPYDIHTGTEMEPEQAGAMPSEPDDDVRFSERLYQDYRASQDEWARRALVDWALANNMPFTPEQVAYIESKGLAPVAHPIVYWVMEQALSLLTANAPRFQAIGRTDDDVKKGKFWADILAWIWYISKGSIHFYDAVEHYFGKGGRGVLYAYQDYTKDFGRGEVCFQALDPLEVFPDPNSRDPLWQDAQHILVVRDITHEQVQQTWPDLAPRVLKQAREGRTDRYVTGRVNYESQQVDQPGRDNAHKKYELIERFSRVRLPHLLVREDVPGGPGGGPRRHKKERLLALPNDMGYRPRETWDAYAVEPAYIISTEQGPQYVYDKEGVAYWDALYAQYGGDGGPVVVPQPMGPPSVDPLTGQPVEAPVTYVEVRPSTKGELVNLGVIEWQPVMVPRVQCVCSIGGALLYKRVLATEHFPVVPINYKHRGNPYPNSAVMYAAPLAHQLNKIQQIIIQHAAATSGITWWAQEGTVKDNAEELLANPKPKVLFYRGEQPPTPAQPQPLPSALYAQQAELKNDIFAAFGLYPFQQGDVSAAPETVGTTLQVDQNSLRRIKACVDRIYASLNQLALVCMDLAADTYTEEKVLRIIEPDGSPRQVAINQPLYDEYGAVVDIMNDVSAIRADVVVVSGSTMPSNRHVEMQYYLRLMEVVGPALLPEVLKKSDIFNWEEVLERVDVIGQLQQQNAALQQQVRQLSGDMQTAEREIRTADRRVADQKYQKQLALQAAGVAARAQVTKERLQDRLNQSTQLMDEIDETL